MHIPESVFTTFGQIATTGAIAAAGMALCLKRARELEGERAAVLLGTMSAFLFAAQMVNFPLIVLPASGHLLGGVLAAVMLGPWSGAVVVGAVLIVQCLLMADGGLTALGANFINMGLIGAIGGYAIYAPIRRAIGGPTGVVLGAMIAAWFSVILSSAALAVELAAAGNYRHFPDILAWMTLVHAGIGVGEAAITGAVLKYVLMKRPDLIHTESKRHSPIASRGRAALAGLGIALAVAVFLAPLASEHPDGFEYVGGKLGVAPEASSALIPSPLENYEMPGLRRFQSISTASAGAVGTLAVCGLGLAMTRTFSVSAKRPEGIASDAV